MNLAKHLTHAKNARGFTLVELMVVVAIVAILAAVAIPQYSDYVLRGALTEATSGLAQQRVSMEQYFLDNRTYAPAGTTPCTTVTGKYFAITCVSAAAPTNTYTFTATGNAGVSAAGFTFTINETNARTTVIASPATWTAGTSTCWVTSKTGC